MPDLLDMTEYHEDRHLEDGDWILVSKDSAMRRFEHLDYGTLDINRLPDHVVHFVDVASFEVEP